MEAEEAEEAEEGEEGARSGERGEGAAAGPPGSRKRCLRGVAAEAAGSRIAGRCGESQPVAAGEEGIAGLAVLAGLEGSGWAETGGLARWLVSSLASWLVG